MTTTATITISQTSDTASTTVTTAGARDYDLTITVGDVEIEAEVTLIPSEYDGCLGSWGSMDHWLSSAACDYARTLTDANRSALLDAIVRACVDGEDVDVDLEYEIDVGDRVEAGEGDDHDTGIVQSINGDIAMVGWDSGVCTRANLSALRPAQA
jgi:hypothetical protein